MIRKIESDTLLVKIDDTGAEIQSIFSKADNCEYLWQADSPYWQRRAPVLFPIVGRLKNGHYRYNETDYAMGIHGFASASLFRCTKEETNRLVYTLSDSAETRAVYPFGFTLQVSFTLEGCDLHIEYLVCNTGNTDLPFGIGAHEGFRCPRYSGECLEDYYLEFYGNVHGLQNHAFSGDGFLLDTSFPIPMQENRLPLTDKIFADYGTLLFKNTDCKKVALKSTKSKAFVEVGYDAPHLAIWKQPGAPFICIEPWHGLPDRDDTNGDFKTKEANTVLPPNGQKSFRHTVSVNAENLKH